VTEVLGLILTRSSPRGALPPKRGLKRAICGTCTLMSLAALTHQGDFTPALAETWQRCQPMPKDFQPIGKETRMLLLAANGEVAAAKDF
jgi:hypothetical protein